MKPQIKICGLTAPEDAVILNEANVEFAGFVVFYEKSKRNLTLSQAREIMNRLDQSIRRVAVTVSPTLAQVREIEAEAFDYVQIHGTLAPDVMRECRLPIFRAVNVEKPEDCARMEDSPKIAGYVFDGKYAGGGASFDWSYLIGFSRKEKMLILAGGLNPDNVGDAIRQLDPDIVDVSSDVELPSIRTERGVRSPGKDRSKVEAFVRAVRNAEEGQERREKCRKNAMDF